MTKAQEERNRIEANQRAAFFKKIENLTGHVFGRIDRKKAGDIFDALPLKTDYASAAEAFAVIVASQEPVGRALHPMKVEAVKSAAQDAQKVVDRVLKDLEAHGWDINAAAPRPDSFREGREEYQRKNSKRQLYSAVTKNLTNSYVRSGPQIVERDEDGIARFISNSEQDAALQYDSFICKMVKKVGEVSDATIQGEHVWGHSILTVVLPNGSTQRWKTQQIINYSVYGRPYLQWPSRIVK